jgi:hypothetical protein
MNRRYNLVEMPEHSRDRIVARILPALLLVLLVLSGTGRAHAQRRPVGPRLMTAATVPDMVQYADVNGDGRADALYFDVWLSRCVFVSLSTGSGFASPRRSSLCHGDSTPEMMQYADVNGDGKADAVYFDTSRTRQVWVSLSIGTDFAPPQPWLQHGDSEAGHIQYADVNGDRRADALYFDTWRSKCVWVSLSTGAGFAVQQSWVCHGDSTPDMIHYADVNGDGKADALYFDTFRTRQVWVSLSTGGAFTAPQPWLDPRGDSEPRHIQFADVNGDGRADALYFDTWRSKCVWVGLSTGTGFAALQSRLCHGDSTPDMIRYADVNGDAKADAVYFDIWRTGCVWASLSTGPSFTMPQSWLCP